MRLVKTSQTVYDSVSLARCAPAMDRHLMAVGEDHRLALKPVKLPCQWPEGKSAFICFVPTGFAVEKTDPSHLLPDTHDDIDHCVRYFILSHYLRRIFEMMTALSQA